MYLVLYAVVLLYVLYCFDIKLLNVREEESAKNALSSSRLPK